MSEVPEEVKNTVAEILRVFRRLRSGLGVGNRE
jgi:hypothetical protein